MIRRSVEELGIKNVEITAFSGLLVDFVAEKNANVIIKGLRAVSDFEYEFQMALMNHKLLRDVETLFMMTSNKYSYLSSSIVKEVARYGGNLTGLVPEGLIPEITDRAMQSKK
jgi:pantetheine-phosphate adenylyltransferase